MQIPHTFTDSEARLVRDLEQRIHSEGWHPSAISEDALLELLPPFEMIHLSEVDRLGLRIDFALHRYMLRYVRGPLGGKHRAPQLLCLFLAAELAIATNAPRAANSPEAIMFEFHRWYRSVFHASERALDEVIERGEPIDRLDQAAANACELAAVSAVYGLVLAPLGHDQDLAVRRLRAGMAMHVADRGSTRGISKELWEVASQYVPMDDRGSAQVLRFFEREVREGKPSVLSITEDGVHPDPLRTKSRADALLGREKGAGDEHEEQAPDDMPEPTDESAQTAAEIAEQADQVATVRDALRRIADSAEPGSSRRIVAEGLLKDPDMSIRALARSCGRQFEGLRRAVREIQKELSRFQ